MRPVVVLMIFSQIALSASHAIATYLDLRDSAYPLTFGIDNAGNVYGASYVTGLSGATRLRITKSDSHGDTLLATDLDLVVTIAGIAADANSNVILAGTAYSPQDLPLVSPLFPAAGGPAAFVIKFDASLQQILFSTLVGGPSGGTYAQALRLDPSGNIFLTGLTNDQQFPVTPGAYKPPDRTDGFLDAFITEISNDGTRLIFSTHLGGELDFESTMGSSGTVIAVDSTGDVVLAGTTRSTGFPFTAGSFSPTCGACRPHLGAGFVAKFDAGGKLLWASYIPVSNTATVSTIVSALEVASDGSILVGGGTSRGFPVTPGALQTTFPQPSGTAGFVIRVNPEGTQLLWATYFGGGGSSSVTGVAIDSAHIVWIAGTSLLAASLPVPKGTPVFGTPYVAGLSADGSSLMDFFSTPEGGAGLGIGITTGQSKVSIGLAGGILSVEPGAGPSLLGITNSAASHVSTSIAPAELVSLYGIGIGPEIPAGGLVVDGAPPQILSGVQVLFDGMPAGLLYAGPNQINAVVSSRVGINGENVTPDRGSVQVITPSGVIDGLRISNRLAAPQVFPSALERSGLAAALNQDGTINSRDNPAAPGTVVAIWVSGCGYSGCSIVLSYSGSLEVLYDSQAPGLVNGLSQVNFRLPFTYNGTNLGFIVQAGTALSDGSFVYMKPK